MDTPVEIAFDCLPLKSVGRMDVPMDASPTYRDRYEKLQAVLQAHGPERTYYLYNAHCIFRFANSEVDGMARFGFEGLVRTDASDSLTELVELEVNLAGETCGGIPNEATSWLAQQVSKASSNRIRSIYRRWETCHSGRRAWAGREIIRPGLHRWHACLVRSSISSQ